MKKIYIIDKVNNIIQTFDNSKDASIRLWGVFCPQTIVIVSNKSGDILVPLEMTKGDVMSIKSNIDSFDND